MPISQPVSASIKGRDGAENTAQIRWWYHSTIGAIFFDALSAMSTNIMMDKMDLATATGRPFRSIPMALLTLGTLGVAL